MYLDLESDICLFYSLDIKCKYTISDNFVNLALSGTASQKDEYSLMSSANKAIDGNRNGIYHWLVYHYYHSQGRVLYLVVVRSKSIFISYTKIAFSKQ